MNTKYDLTGQQFGKLTVLNRSLQNSCKWICHCDCGQTTSVITGALVNGSTKSCGCLNREQKKTPKLNLNGERYGRLVILNRSTEDSNKFNCICDCGNTKTVALGALRKGETKSCGCLQKEISALRLTTHGLSGTPEHNAWRDMVQRCSNSNDDVFHYYGGRGIQVCERWKLFENFFADMGPRPSPDHSIDRYPNNDGNYEPGNCRWATWVEQANNRRIPEGVYTDQNTGKKHTARELANLYGITNIKAFSQRLANGWDVERAINQPIL